MKYFLTVGLLTICCLSCSQNKKEKNKSLEHEVKICLVDTLDLANSFWQINRLLEKEQPEQFKSPPDYSDTTNDHYITHYIKRFRITVGGKTTKLDKFCVTTSDTSTFISFVRNRNYKKFFTTNSYFAFRFEKNNCLDLFLLTDQSVSFKKSDLSEFSLDHGPFGLSIAIRLTSEAGKRLKEFSKNNIGREVAFIIDDVIYYNATIGAPLDHNAFAIYPDLTADEINKLLFSSK